MPGAGITIPIDRPINRTIKFFRNGPGLIRRARVLQLCSLIVDGKIRQVCCAVKFVNISSVE